MTSATVRDGGVRRDIRTTASVPAKERRVYWHKALFPAFGAVDVSVPTDEHSGSIRTAPLGRLKAVTVEGGGLIVRRTRPLLPEDDGECVALKLLDAGVARVQQDGRDTQLGPGDMFVYDTARPVRLDLPQAFRLKSLVIPRDTLRPNDQEVAHIKASRFGVDTSLKAVP